MLSGDGLVCFLRRHFTGLYAVEYASEEMQVFGPNDAVAKVGPAGRLPSSCRHRGTQRSAFEERNRSRGPQPSRADPAQQKENTHQGTFAVD